jgi:hypothetical protein
MALTPKQRDALQWLSKQPWRSPWWGGKPHGRWPKELPSQTYNSLSLAKLIETRSGEWSDKIVSISEAGKAAITSVLCEEK